MSNNNQKEVNLSWEKNMKDGKYNRVARTFIASIGEESFPAENGRYHLYVSHACPWAHRTMIVKELFGLDVTYDVVDYHLIKSEGWTLQKKDEAATLDSQNGFSTLRQVYEQSEPGYNNTVTVPVLYDKIQRKIVNNESSLIIRQFNEKMRPFHTKNKHIDLYPENLRAKIDEVNQWIYDDINNGVYKCGFAQSQESYTENVKKLFVSLQKVEEILTHNRYLCGEHLTEADVRLFTTLIRFDAVYVCHFKCNVKRIVDLPNVWGYVKELYSIPAFKSTTNHNHIKKHYYVSHQHINPFGIVPEGPEINFEEQHDRQRLKGATTFEQ